MEPLWEGKLSFPLQLTNGKILLWERFAVIILVPANLEELAQWDHLVGADIGEGLFMDMFVNNAVKGATAVLRVLRRMVKKSKMPSTTHWRLYGFQH